MDKPKISEVTKALKKAGFKAISAEEALESIQPAMTYFKYKGALYINAGCVGFGIESAEDAKIFRKYHTHATADNGRDYEVATDAWQFFFPRLFGFLSGEISEAQIIAEICK